MKAYVEGILRIVENAAFKDSKTMESVDYFVNYIQDENAQLIKVGSRVNHTDMVGRDAVFEIECKPDFSNPRLFRLSLLEVKPAK